MRWMAVAVLLVLCGCQSPLPDEQPPLGDPSPPVPADDGLEERLPDTCGAAVFATIIGQPRAAAEGVLSDRPLRVIGPDDIVTQEYNPQRVNFYVNADGLIARVSCG